MTASNLGNAIWPAHENRPECEQFRMTGCCPRENNIGMRGSPCSPPSSCGRCCVSPSPSSHKHVDGLPQKHRTKGRTDLRSPFLNGPLNIEFLETRSYAPTPSMDTVVALLSTSETLHVVNALTTFFRGQRALERSGGLLGLLRNLLRHGSCDQPAHDVSHDDPSHTTIRLQQRRQSPHTESFTDLRGHKHSLLPNENMRPPRASSRPRCREWWTNRLLSSLKGPPLSLAALFGHQKLHRVQLEGPLQHAIHLLTQLPLVMVAFPQDRSVWPALPRFQVPQAALPTLRRWQPLA